MIQYSGHVISYIKYLFECKKKVKIMSKRHQCIKISMMTFVSCLPYRASEIEQRTSFLIDYIKVL